MATRLRNIKCLHPLFQLRDNFMHKTSLFKIKAKVKYAIFLKYLVVMDNLKKKRIARAINKLPNGLLSSQISKDDIVCSVTSHGCRVHYALPYMLYSLLTQEKLPKKIVVFLDYDHWSDANLPPLLRKLQQVGVEFYYCEDIKSYKKLIPAMRMFPNNPILTLDDDFYFHPKHILWLTEAYEQSDKKTVIGQWGCIPIIENGRYLPYSQWVDWRKGDEDAAISFFGGLGCIYPPIFDEEILKSSIFMKLCPTADDIWFWAMEERQHIKRTYIKQKGYGYHIPVDRIYDYDIAGDNCLNTINGLQGQNDVQLRALLDYYNLEDENF